MTQKVRKQSDTNEPEKITTKKGIRRFFEIWFREFRHLLLLNVLVCVCIAPSIILFVIVFQNIPHSSNLLFWLSVILFVFSCSLTGAALTAGSYCLSKMVSDTPGFLWHDFKKAFKASYRKSFLMGAVYAVLSGVYIQCLYANVCIDESITLVYLLLSVVLLHMVYPVFFLQAAYIDLDMPKLLKNSLLLSIGHAKRTFAGAIFLILAKILVIICFPASIVIVIIFGYSIPSLINMMWVWPVVNQTFNIDGFSKQNVQDANSYSGRM